MSSFDWYVFYLLNRHRCVDETARNAPFELDFCLHKNFLVNEKLESRRVETFSTLESANPDRNVVRRGATAQDSLLDFHTIILPHFTSVDSDGTSKGIGGFPDNIICSISSTCASKSVVSTVVLTDGWVARG